MTRNAVLLGFSLLVCAPLWSQVPAPEYPAPSPASSLKQRIGVTDVEVVYSRPSLKGREILGRVEAFGRVWRTGANAATRISFSTPVTFEGSALPAGDYSLFSIPGADEWTIILSRNTKLWGAYGYNPEEDVLRVKVKPEKLAVPVETFTIDFNDLRDESATLNLIWETTRVPIQLGFDVKSRLTPQVEAFMAAPGDKSANDYYKAAVYYVDHEIDLNKAKTWIELALQKAEAAKQPAFFAYHTQARILAKLGDKAGAVAAANKSIETAVTFEGPQSPFIKLNKDLIASLP